jgi:hypothetical protein
MNETAIVTIAIGEPYLSNWTRFCSHDWQTYAARHGLDLIVISQPFEQSGRSPAWQKCLVLSQEFAAKYRQVVLVDADVAINPSAPNIIEQVPVESVGGVISGSHIHDDLKSVLLSRLNISPRIKQFGPYERGSRAWRNDQNRYYTMHGLLPPQTGGIVQTGVLVASPQHHAAIFRSIYQGTYLEDRGYEQVPLSHALLSGGHFRQIDTRFNSTLFETLMVHHSYLSTESFGENVIRAVVRAEFVNNFFLHFAYDQSLMRFLAD